MKWTEPNIRVSLGQTCLCKELQQSQSLWPWPSHLWCQKGYFLRFQVLWTIPRVWAGRVAEICPMIRTFFFIRKEDDNVPDIAFGLVSNTPLQITVDRLQYLLSERYRMFVCHSSRFTLKTSYSYQIPSGSWFSEPSLPPPSRLSLWLGRHPPPPRPICLTIR